MKNYRFILEPYNGIKTRFVCPKCHKKNKFTKYVDLHTNEYLHDYVGCCNRKIKCGYHYTPKQYFENNNISLIKSNYFIKTEIKQKPNPSFIDSDYMTKSKNSKNPNYFIDFLTNHWNKEVAFELAEKYNIGTSNNWQGANVFWQVDINNNIRSGKIMLYNASSGKRIKKPYNHINWVHNILKIENFHLEQCYFGEHLLNEDKNKPVAIVESEKTAIISSVYLPEFIWLACGSVNNLNESKTKVLKGRNVVLFPDLNCYDIWNKKITVLTKLATFRTSTLLQEKATEKEKELGLDIADYLINLKI
ncbi:DUF6371 domain-containing protein [Xanthomarina sp. F2636L]|uniref:DUF6371 domain-containing protein n=1 Tax=Xanthomarina sp. F2636L TaxID=2996018 RepID=UPI00225E5FB8|nr:DUF6371 domain-containing protein [Xanthomarina sp. F2636L]MCX7551547.1 DUF6371 domain-containing protein [Xanthomarina sp. F2636L]